MSKTIFVLLLFLAPAVFAVEVKPLTLKDCYEDDREGYCFWDLAEQDKDFSYCDLYESASSCSQCFDGVAKLRKPTVKDCEGFNKHKELCLKKVSGRE